MAGCTNGGAFAGRQTIVYFAIGCPDAQPTSTEYKRLGMMRSKTISMEWETADATADMSADFTTEQLTTYKSVSFSGDGITRREDMYNQNELKRHVYNPGPETDSQPYVWLKIISPNDITEGPFTVSSWSDENPHDDVATWSIEAASAGGVAVRDVGAVVQITVQNPDTLNVVAGQSIVLSVSAIVSDDSTIKYQWYKGDNAISTATAARFEKTNSVVADSGAYHCEVSTATAPAVVSNTTTVTVTAE